MTYEQWRNEIFGQPPGRDPVFVELSQQFYNLPEVEAFDHVDQALLDAQNLRNLYSNFFARYCKPRVTHVGNDMSGHLDHVCYMFWDVLVLYPGNATPSMMLV